MVQTQWHGGSAKDSWWSRRGGTCRDRHWERRKKERVCRVYHFLLNNQTSVILCCVCFLSFIFMVVDQDKKKKASLNRRFIIVEGLYQVTPVQTYCDCHPSSYLHIVQSVRSPRFNRSLQSLLTVCWCLLSSLVIFALWMKWLLSSTSTSIA